MSESSVSDDTASSCTELSEEGLGVGGWGGGGNVLPLLARFRTEKKGGVSRGNWDLQHSLQVKKWDDAFF